MTCPVCRGFDFASLWHSYSKEYSCADLFSAADKGCKTCRILKEAIGSFCKIDQPSEAAWHYSMPAILDRKAEKEQSLELKVRWLNSSKPQENLELYRSANDKDRHCPWGSFFPARYHVPQDTRSATSHTWAEGQLARCLAEHADCGSESQNQPALPTRVIDVGIGSAGDSVKLIHTQGACGRYIALSHCWGDPKLMMAKLTAHTIRTYQIGIPITQLPRTFRDAVDVTRKLSVRYLWIDSLCIIQEDPENDSDDDKKLSWQDWTQEAGKMCAVYQNSHVTLAAASASGSNIGFFFNSSRTVELSGIMDEKDYSIFVRRRPEHDLDSFPLMRRGWVTQETLLPPRTLIFGESELMWRCRAVMACQCSKKPHPNAVENQHWRKLPDPSRFAAQSGSRDLIHVWYDMARNYSHTALTYETDRLAAFDGIAQYMRPLKTGDYLAGLWSETLGPDLLWAVLGDGAKRRAHGEPRRMTPWSSDKWLFPTWSWASVQGGMIGWIHANLPKAPPRETFLVEYVKDNSAVSAGGTGLASSRPSYKLRVSGVLIPSTMLAIRSGSTSKSANSPQGRKYSYYPDYDGQERDLAPSALVYCLRAFRSYDASIHDESYESLVLLCIDEMEQEYERVGLLSFSYNTHGHYGSGPVAFEPAPHWWGDVESQNDESVITIT